MCYMTTNNVDINLSAVIAFVVETPKLGVSTKLLVLFILLFGSYSVQAIDKTETLRPNAAGTYQEWNGTHSAATSDQDDATFIYIGVDEERDIQSLQNSTGSGIINSVTVWAKLRATGIITKEKANTLIRTNSTDYLGAAVIIDRGAWKEISTTYTKNPNTSAAWTWAEVDALESGVQLTTIGIGEQMDCAEIWVVVDYTETLPIELLFFKGECNNGSVSLNWSTISETNNDYFTIEKSDDGINFEIITIINGAGNSNTQQDYFVIDENPYKGINYYRLKQTDYDGKYEYSDIIAISNIDNLTNGLTRWFYPNPASENLNIIWEGKQQNMELEIYDITGRIVLNQQIENNASISINHINKGLYFVKLSDNIKTIYTEKIVLE